MSFAEEKKMKKWPLITIACALLLSGCSSIKFVPSLEERSRPQVTVADGRIALNQDVLFFFPDERDVTVVWQLPKSTRYRFPKENGIVIEGRLSDRRVAGGVGLDRQDEIVNCSWRNDSEFSCLNRHRVPGVYKYTIRVEDVETKKTIERDPAFVNM
ncbi:MAG: hypothetical protein ABI580_01045 [Burkholderiaceae bacterium]